jgi:RNA polymerase sigma factor (sigma-70 family)
METDERGDGAYIHQVTMLFRKHRELVFRTAFRLTGDQRDAEDVVQTIFLNLIEEGDKGKRPPGFIKNPPGYLHNAAINRALNVIRTRKRERLEDDDVEFLEVEQSASGARHENDLQRMRAALAEMPAEQVEILNLFYKEQYTGADVAGMTGKGLPTVFVALCRARKQVRKLMGIEEKRRETKEKKHAAASGRTVTDAAGAEGGRIHGPGVETDRRRTAKTRHLPSFSLWRRVERRPPGES